VLKVFLAKLLIKTDPNDEVAKKFVLTEFVISQATYIGLTLGHNIFHSFFTRRNSVRLSVCPSVCPSHEWISQKLCKTGSPSLHRRLPRRSNRKAFP